MSKKKAPVSAMAAALGRMGGSSTSEAKRASSARNARKASESRAVMTVDERSEIRQLYLNGVPRKEILAKFSRLKPRTVLTIMYRPVEGE